MNVELDLKLHQNQKIIMDSPALIKVVKAGKRFGKSELAVFLTIKAAGNLPGGVFWYIAPYFSHAEGIAWQRFKDLIPMQYIRRQQENKLTIELVNGARIILKGADNQVSLRGPKLDGVILDEAAYMDRYIWNNILRGQLLGTNGERPGFAVFISSPINPVQVVGKNFRDWYPEFYQEALRKKNAGDKDYDAFHFTIYDNPLLSKEYIDAIKADATDDEWNVEYMANESAYAGTMVSEFRFDEHVKQIDLNGQWSLVRGLDWGIAHPTACIWANVNMGLKKIHISDEFERSNLVISEACEIIKQITGTRHVEWSVIDPSMNKRDKNQYGRRELDEFNRYGIWVTPGDNRNRGIDIMKMFFKKNMITIDPKCRYLINQIKTVQYGQKEGEDLIDSLRYCLVRIHDLMFNWKEELNEDRIIRYSPEALKERREVNLNNKYMFPETVVNGNLTLDWLREESGVD